MPDTPPWLADFNSQHPEANADQRRITPVTDLTAAMQFSQAYAGKWTQCAAEYIAANPPATQAAAAAKPAMAPPPPPSKPPQP